MTDVVARLRQLEAAATPGPWYIEKNGTIKRGMLWIAHMAGAMSNPAVVTDADVIVAARNALPQLLDERDLLLAVAEAAKEIEAELRWRASMTNEVGQCEPPYTAVSLLSGADLLRDALAALDSQETE